MKYNHGQTTWRVSERYERLVMVAVEVFENIYLRFQYWTAVQVVQSNP
jgi:hypothetical protein